MPQIAPPHGQAYFGTRRVMHKGQDGVPGFCAASGRLKRKSAVRQNGAIKTGADNGAHGRASRAPTPQAKAFGRIPINRPLGGFLDGIPPHRFEPRSVLEKWGKEDWALKPYSPQSQRAEARCPRLRRRMAKRTSVRAEPCTRGKMGRQASAQRQVTSNEKAPFVRTAQ